MGVETQMDAMKPVFQNSRQIWRLAVELDFFFSIFQDLETCRKPRSAGMR